MRIDTNCPNCAAVITGPTCEYCGTIFVRQKPDEDLVLRVKTESLRNQLSIKALYEDALRAMHMNADILGRFDD